MVLNQQKCLKWKCGKSFRQSLRKPSPNIQQSAGRSSHRRVRIVPAFTVQALQRGTKVEPPPKCGVFQPRPVKPTQFRQCYLRGELPICIEYNLAGKRIGWKVPVEKLDFHHYMPMFFDGLAETAYPYNYFVQQGIKDLIAKGSYKVLPVIPQLIIPIKKALSTKRPVVICNTLKAIQAVVVGCDRVGEALVPYYRQILPVVNLYKDKNLNLGAGIDHTAATRENVGDLTEETLQILERYGGVDAFINIKYMIPTYESCVMN